ncbi:MAG: magnesium/cobalt transporter CorA [Armatimonadetes bacterium]|nr:magnesium/cobalt transporter CorA [Armatimonadota bacterium]
MQVTVYREEGVAASPAEPLAALLERDSQAVWVDLDRDRPEDLQVLAEVFGFHPLAIEDAQKTGQRPKVESYDDYLFLTVHTARYDRGGQVALDEVDIFFTRRAVVTVRAAGLAPMDEARVRLGKAPARLRRSPDFVLYSILDVVVDTYFPVLDRIDDHIERLEDHLFKRPTNRTLSGLFRTKRALLAARRHVVPLRDALNLLMRREAGLVTEQVMVYLRDIYDHVLRLTDQIDTHRDLLTGALEIYLTLVSNRLNEVMKVLTVITAIVGPMAVITGIYGMNFTRPYPLFDWPYGFWTVIGVMAALAVGMLFLFRRRGYL